MGVFRAAAMTAVWPICRGALVLNMALKYLLSVAGHFVNACMQNLTLYLAPALAGIVCIGWTVPWARIWNNL